MNIKKITLTVLGLFVVIQFIPYGKDHTNPKVVASPQWDSPQTQSTFIKIKLYLNIALTAI